MEAIVQLMTDQPQYLAGTAVLALFLLFGLIKKMIKLAAIVAVVGAGYAYFVHQTAVEYYDSAAGLASRVQSSVGEAVDSGKGSLDKVMDKLSR